jgi:soluble lytic murein transglycosylase-like protein
LIGCTDREQPVCPEPVQPVSSIQAEAQAITSFLTGYIDSALAVRYARIIVFEAHRNRVPAGLITAIILQESRADSSAIGPRFRVPGNQWDRAQGLMQIAGYWWEGAFPDCGANILHPETNICYGVRIFRIHYMNSQQNIYRALEDYSGRARRYQNLVLERAGEFYFHKNQEVYDNDND